MTADSAVEAVRRRLLSQIATGELRPGHRLGGERELAAGFGVSRSTLRHALGLLEEAGAVRRVPGRGGGTFVGAAKVERDLSRVVGVPALLREQGFTAGSRVVRVALTGADDASAAALELKPGEPIVEIVRIRLADGIPISLEQARFPARLFPGLPELPLGGSLYELLEERFGVAAADAVERIEAVPAGPGEAAVLDVEEGTPLLSVTRTTRTAGKVAFEFSHDLFRADRTRIVVRTPGGAARSVDLGPGFWDGSS